MKRILSISGGGMRGVIPCEILVEMERRTGRPIADLFDLIAGTSTGGILALLMAAGVSARKAMDFYYEAGPRIFAKSLGRKVYSLGGMLHTKYRSHALREELVASIGEGLLRDARTRVMVTTLTHLRAAEMVKSWVPEWEDLPMAVAALMTSSAQTYFPQARIMHRGREVGYLDGGNVRNAPMACAAFEAARLWLADGEPMTLYHLGTGMQAEGRPLPNGGALTWAAEIFDTVTRADDSYDDYFCRGLEGFLPGFRYHRMDVVLPEFPPLDDASRRTLDGLRAATRAAMGAHMGAWEDALSALEYEDPTPA